MSVSQRRQVAALLLGTTAVLALVAMLVAPQQKAFVLEEEPEFEDEVEEEPQAPQIHPEVHYIALHPVYGRCKKQVNMPEFASLIQKTCGNIHELQEIAYPCRQAMYESSQKFGCCWETVMDGYKMLYPHAFHAWRMWQGTLSGKAGITFDDDSCGESMGEKNYQDLKGQVDSLEDTIEDQNYEIQFLESQLGYGYGYTDPYGYYYKGKKGDQLQQKHQLPPRGMYRRQH